jgi:hypothetical protein
MRYLFFAATLLIQTACAQTTDERKLKCDSLINAKPERAIILDTDQLVDPAMDGGAELTGYVLGNNIVKIVAEVGLSNGNRTMEYIMEGRRLVCVHETFNSFVYNDSDNAFDYHNTERTFEGHYYFKEDKLIDHITLGHNRFEDDSIDIEKALTKEASKYYSSLRKKLNNN